MAKSRSLKRWCLFGVIAFVILFLPCGVLYHGDGAARYAQAKSLLFDQSISSSVERATSGGTVIGGMLALPDGRYLCKYGIGMPLVWTLPLAVATLTNWATGQPVDRVAHFLISFINPIVTALTGFLLMIAARRLRLSSSAAGWAIAVWLLGTSALPYANSAFSEPLCGLLLLGGVLLSQSWVSYRQMLGGLAIGFAALTKPELALLSGVIPVCLFLHGMRRQALVSGFTAFAIGPVVILGLNYHFNGSPLRFSYGDESAQFMLPWQALRGYVWSWDKSILLYNMALIPCIAGWWTARRDAPTRLMGLVTAGVWCAYLPFYACWWAWEGGLCFGPRFFVTFMPLTAVGTAILVDRYKNATPLLRRRFCYGLLTCVLIVSTPLQWLGLAIHDEQADYVARECAVSSLYTRGRLAFLKVSHGVFTDESYSVSQFNPALQDKPLRFDGKETYIAFRHWPLTALGMKLRRHAPTQ